MMTMTRKMAETLERLDLHDKRDWFNRRITELLAKTEESMYGVEHKKGSGWQGLDAVLREAKEEAKRQASGVRILRLDRSDRSSNWQHHKTEGENNQI